MLDTLKNLVAEHLRQAANILNKAVKKNTKYFELAQWIIAQTHCIDSIQPSIAQRAHWILNSLSSLPCCLECGKSIDNSKQFISISAGYKDFCSSRCGKKHAARNGKQTRLQKNNGQYFSQESKDKAKASFMKHYGVDHNMKCAEGRNALSIAVQKKYGKDVKNVWQAAAVKEKIKQTKELQHGDKNWNNYLKMSKTKAVRYGLAGYSNSKQARETCLKKYGVEHPLQVPEIIAKARKTRAAHSYRYFINDVTFDSFPEFCFYVWAKDSHLDVIREPKDKHIVYEDKEGKQHTYFPDFYVKQWDRIVEVKGDNHFRDNDPAKELISLKGEEYNHIAAAKQQAMTQNDVLVLTSKDYKKYVSYVKQKYGKRYIEQHRMSKSNKIALCQSK